MRRRTTWPRSGRRTDFRKKFLRVSAVRGSWCVRLQQPGWARCPGWAVPGLHSLPASLLEDAEVNAVALGRDLPAVRCSVENLRHQGVDLRPEVRARACPEHLDCPSIHAVLELDVRADPVLRHEMH